eukprot:TRINITY_DN2353_c0_g1_i1.p1 TRINITY_DN2353_c0_g1~~TRINITY_DN2353_c0_g1_i1.p1  ORF type:complete len:149 (+),score=29.40 TRINITY_DN2353_c0_g1_i1:20-466(+)
MALRRLNMELRNFYDDPPSPSITITPDGADTMHWGATISGPVDGPYEGGIFFLNLHFPSDYPFRPPTCTMETKIYHPNVNTNGKMCIPLLKNSWGPHITIATVLLEIVSLLQEPYLDEPLMPDIARQYIEDREAFNDSARQWTSRFAN